MLEEELRSLTDAINRLTDTLQAVPRSDESTEAGSVTVVPYGGATVPMAIAVPTATTGTSPEAEAAPAKTYKIEDLQRAMVPLCDKGKLGEIQGMIKGLGYSSLMDVPQDQYEAVADGLRGLGAQI